MHAAVSPSALVSSVMLTSIPFISQNWNRSKRSLTGFLVKSSVMQAAVCVETPVEVCKRPKGRWYATLLNQFSMFSELVFHRAVNEKCEDKGAKGRWTALAVVWYCTFRDLFYHKNVMKQREGRASYKLLLSTNCTISCVPTRSSGGWEISSGRCNHSISYSWNAEHWQEEQLWSSVCELHGPHRSYDTETERLQDSRGRTIIMFPDA